MYDIDGWRRSLRAAAGILQLQQRPCMSRRRRREEGLGCEGCAAEPTTAPALLLQAIALAKRPHIVVGTPGRVVDHLSNTKGFSLKVRSAASGGARWGASVRQVEGGCCRRRSRGDGVYMWVQVPQASCPASRHHPCAYVTPAPLCLAGPAPPGAGRGRPPAEHGL